MHRPQSFVVLYIVKTPQQKELSVRRVTVSVWPPARRVSTELAQVSCVCQCARPPWHDTSDDEPPFERERESVRVTHSERVCVSGVCRVLRVSLKLLFAMTEFYCRPTHHPLFTRSHHITRSACNVAHPSIPRRRPHEECLMETPTSRRCRRSSACPRRRAARRRRSRRGPSPRRRTA